MLFNSGKLGNLDSKNRIVRSATAERMADHAGRPLPSMKSLYRDLARGGVDIIITGHMYVHPSGKAHSEMSGIYHDDLIPDLAELARTVHENGAKVVLQINHGGMQCDEDVVEEPIAPSAIGPPISEQSAREMRPEEVELLVEAFAQAARRAKEAGFDGVQIHAAHGYLISQFLSPLVNRRDDTWGGDPIKRRAFLKAVCLRVREVVGPEFPMLIKLGMMDGPKGGLSADEAIGLVAALDQLGLDGLEISGGIEGSGLVSSREDIQSEGQEAYFRPLAVMARSATDLPIILVGGLRSRSVMEDVLRTGDADFVSVCRPLICEPDLPNLMRLEIQDASRCISANECWPLEDGVGIACRCPID